MRKLFSILIKKARGVKVYALVGRAGTGKSFRARLVMEKYGIRYLIDDGILIRDNQILAGRSAKRENSRVKAIKCAIFENGDHARQVREAISRERIDSILILGISEKMVGRIAERLGLPFPDRIIYIDDLATRDEIMHATEMRRTRGKHVIPVPQVEVKQDSAQRIIDSVRLFLRKHPLFFWKDKIVEKTIVQPLFSSRGRLSISREALGQMIMHCVDEFTSDIEIRRITIDRQNDGYQIEIRIDFPYKENIPEALSKLQEYIVTHIERYSGITIESLNLTVDRIIKKKYEHKNRR